MKTILILVICLISSSFLFSQEAMTNKKLGEIVRAEADSVAGQSGNWQVLYQERLIFVITDTKANRMRIFTPVISSEGLDEAMMKAMLIANFHTALDAKYSIYEGFVISTFTHPLAELTEDQALDAFRQVARLADNFGTTFTSTDFFFGGGSGEKAPVEEKKKKKRTTKRS